MPYSGSHFNIDTTIAFLHNICMIIGTWKPEPASEEAWEVNWTMDEPNPEYMDEESYNQFLDQQHKQAWLLIKVPAYY